MRRAVAVLHLSAGAAVNAFYIALLSFGWGFYLWSLPMVWTLSTLLRGELGAADARSFAPIREVTGHARAA